MQTVAMCNDIRPRLEAGIDLAVRATRAAWKWLLEQHRLAERMRKAIAVKRSQVERLLR